jgi:cell wall assembly regulator SMI1
VTDIEREWLRVEAWLHARARPLHDALAVGAKPEALDALEAALAVKLPPDARALYALRDGQAVGSVSVLPGWEWLGLGGILEQWRIWKGLLDAGEFKDARSEPAEGIRDDWWHPRWIPFTHNGAGDHLCLDLMPAPGGRAGQVITMWHDDAPRERLASSLTAWVRELADKLDAGRYVYVDEEGTLLDADEV